MQDEEQYIGSIPITGRLIMGNDHKQEDGKHYIFAWQDTSYQWFHVIDAVKVGAINDCVILTFLRLPKEV